VNDSQPGSDWPEWCKPRRGKILDSFWLYHERLKQILRGDGPLASDPPHLYQLPPSVHELARQSEESKEFLRLLLDLFELRRFEKDKIRGFFQAADNRSRLLNDALRRSGYYHAVIAGEPPEEYFQRIADRLQYGRRQFSRYWC
jgi:hypothetical protein